MPDLERQHYLIEIERLTKLVDALTATITAQTDTIAEMAAKIDALQQIIKDLTEKVNKNSRNSSKPPSSDGYSKPNPKSQRKKSGRKQGGQAGHPGSNMALPHEPDEVKRHFPEKCLRCPKVTDCIKDGTISSCEESRYVVDVVVSTKVTEHQTMKVRTCPLGEVGLCGSFPEAGAQDYLDVMSYLSTGKKHGISTAARIPFHCFLLIIRFLSSNSIESSFHTDFSHFRSHICIFHLR